MTGDTRGIEERFNSYVEATAKVFQHLRQRIDELQIEVTALKADANTNLLSVPTLKTTNISISSKEQAQEMVLEVAVAVNRELNPIDEAHWVSVVEEWMKQGQDFEEIRLRLIDAFE
jgi:uncharacterized protein YigA (DUF484 family)